MGNKKRKYPNVEDILCRPWCYYCERDFEDLKLLISHQKAKHFKCDRCGRRLNTAGGLAVHMNQVHKETLSQVDHALPHRRALDVEIFGLEGIPAEIMDQHRNRVIQNFYQAQEDRRLATGNIQPGQGVSNSRKKFKIETADELKARLAEHRLRVKGQKAAANAPAPVVGLQPNYNSPLRPQPAFGSLPADPQHRGFPAPQMPLQYPIFPPIVTLPARPSGALPTLPGLATHPSQAWSATVDADADMGDDIDQLIRMAEAGIKPQREGIAVAPALELAVGPAVEPLGNTQTKQELNKGLVSSEADEDLSPEERMAMLPRYAFVVKDES